VFFHQKRKHTEQCAGEVFENVGIAGFPRRKKVEKILKKACIIFENVVYYKGLHVG